MFWACLRPMLLLVALAAPAGEIQEAARQAANRGMAAYNLGSYEEAARAYEESYRLVQDPVLLFNLGQSWRLAGNPDKALIAYRSYLRTAPADAPNRAQVERRIPELEALIARARSAPTPLAAPGAPATAARPRPMVALAPPPEPRAAPAFVPSVGARPDADHDGSPGALHRWWFWAGAGAVVAGAVVAGVLLSSRGGGRLVDCGAGVDVCTPVP
jgi:tetratricopeptide (TPR) repeat protein